MYKKRVVKKSLILSLVLISSCGERERHRGLARLSNPWSFVSSRNISCLIVGFRVQWDSMLLRRRGGKRRRCVCMPLVSASFPNEEELHCWFSRTVDANRNETSCLIIGFGVQQLDSVLRRRRGGRRRMSLHATALSARFPNEEEFSCWFSRAVIDSNRNEKSWSSRNNASLQSSASSGLSGVNSSWSSSGWNSTIFRFRSFNSELDGAFSIDSLSFESVTMVLQAVFMFWDLVSGLLGSKIVRSLGRKSEGSSPVFVFWRGDAWRICRLIIRRYHKSEAMIFAFVHRYWVVCIVLGHIICRDILYIRTILCSKSRKSCNLARVDKWLSID